MMMRQKMNHEFLNCSRCLLRYIKWPLFLLLTFLSGSICYYLSMKYISTAATTKEALRFYWSCPPTNNFLLVIAFYLATFLPAIFVLRFLDYKICTEYYVVRLKTKRNFILSKMFCVIVLNLTNIFLRLLIFVLYNSVLYPYLPIAANDLLFSLIFLVLIYVTFNFMIFLFFSFAKNATVIFVIFSVLFLFSLYLIGFRMPGLLFWMYGLNFYNLTPTILYGDLMLLILTIEILLIRHYDILTKEDEKSE